MKKGKLFNKKAVKFGVLYVTLFGLSAAGAYWFTPYLNGSLDDDYREAPSQMTDVDRFMSKLTSLTGFKGTINELNFSFPDNDGVSSTYNVFKLKEKSQILLSMPDMDHLGFHLDTVFTLSTPGSDIPDVSKPMFVNYDGQDLYLSMLGAKYKYLASDYETIMDDIIEVVGKDGVTIDPSFYTFIEGLIGGIASGGSGVSMPEMAVSFVEKEEAPKDAHAFTCTITLGGNDYAIDMTSDNDFNLTSIKADVRYKDFAFKVDIDTDMNGAPVGSLASLAPADKDSYTSVVNMHGVFKKIANLAKTKSFDVAFEGGLTYKYKNGETKLDDSILVSAGASLNFDKNDYRLDLELKGNEEQLSFKKMGLAYLPAESDLPNAAYLNYNDVYKVSMDTMTMDALMGKVKDSIGSSASSSFDAKKLSGLFSFVTDSEVMKAISSGHYQAVVNMIDDLKTSNDKIVAGINLSGLGLGENAKVVATVDGLSEANSKLLKVEIQNIALSDTLFNGTLTLDSYSGRAFSRTGFNDLKKMPDVYDQFASIAKNEKAGIGLEAKIGSDVTLNGSLQFDAKNLLGTGKIEIDEPNKKHLLKTDFNKNDVRLQYQDAELLNEKGTLAKISIKSVHDLIDYLLTVTKSERFERRFLSPLSSAIGEVALSSTLTDIVNGRYSVLTETDILKGYTFTDDRSVFTVNAAALGLDKDLSFAINYASEAIAGEGGEVTHKVESLELLETEMLGTDMSLKIIFGDYNDDKTSNLSFGDEEFNDFSHVSTLTEALLNTATDFDTYHVKASADVTLWTANIIHAEIDFVANYAEAGWEYYVKVSDIPLIPAINSQYNIFLGYKRSVELVFKDGTVSLLGVNPFGKHGYETEEDRQNNGEKIDWTETNAGTYSKEYLSSNENLLKFLLGDVLNVQPYYLDQIASSGTSMDMDMSALSIGGKLAYEKVLESTSFDPITNDYSMTLNVGEMLNSDYVVKAELGAKVNDGNYLTQLSLSAFAFAGVRVDFDLCAQLLDVGEPLSASLRNAMSNVVSKAEAGIQH